jgi:hypothetical protein
MRGTTARETELYGLVKAMIEAQGYDVKGESPDYEARALENILGSLAIEPVSP